MLSQRIGRSFIRIARAAQGAPSSSTAVTRVAQRQPALTSVCRLHTATTIQTVAHDANGSEAASPSVGASSPPVVSTPPPRLFTVAELLRAIENPPHLQPPITTDNNTNDTTANTTPPVNIRLRGWLRSIRGSKSTSFLLLNDGTSLLSVQCVLDASVSEAAGCGAGQLQNGASVEITGQLVWSYKYIQNLNKQIAAAKAAAAADGTPQVPIDPLASFASSVAAAAGSPMPQMPLMEVLASDIRIFGTCDQSTYPMTKQSLPLEHLREYLHLRTRTNTLASVMRVRSHAQMGIHQFFQEEGFFNVHTPILTPLDCEGAGEVFSVTSSLEKPDQPFFGRPTYLTVSGQLYGEMLACSLSRVYTFGPTFRAEHSQTVRHLNEFWMVEPEMAHMDLDQTIQLAERFVKFMINYTIKHCETDLRFLQSRFQPTLLSTLASTVSSKFIRLTYTEAIEILQKSKHKWEFQPTWENGLQSEHEKFLAEVKFKAPVFITNYPRASKPFYMKTDDASLATPGRETVSCFDLIIPGVGELIGGSVREERYEQLLANMATHKLDPKLYSWYLDLRTYGTVPHAGFGLGFERLLRYLTSMANIRDLIPVPRTPGPQGGHF